MCQAQVNLRLRLKLRLWSELRFGLGSRLRLGLRLGFGSRCSSVFLLFGVGGWVVGVGGVGWLEKSDIKLTSAKVEIEVEADLGKRSHLRHYNTLPLFCNLYSEKLAR